MNKWCFLFCFFRRIDKSKETKNKKEVSVSNCEIVILTIPQNKKESGQNIIMPRTLIKSLDQKTVADLVNLDLIITSVNFSHELY